MAFSESLRLHQTVAFSRRNNRYSLRRLLFPDAETAENPVQDVVGINDAHDFA